MKISIATMILLISFSSLAATYDCTIDHNKLGSEFGSDITFQLNVNAGQTPAMFMFGDNISDSCFYQEENIVICKDAEGMPYKAEILSPTEIILSVGYILPPTSAECSIL